MTHKAVDLLVTHITRTLIHRHIHTSHIITTSTFTQIHTHTHTFTHTPGDIPRELSSLISKWGGGLAIPLNRGPVAIAAYGAQRKSTHAILHPRASLQSPPWPTVASVSVVISEQMRRLEEKFERDFPREKVSE